MPNHTQEMFQSPYEYPLQSAGTAVERQQDVNSTTSQHAKKVRNWVISCAIIFVLVPVVSIVLGLLLKPSQFSYTSDTTQLFEERTLQMTITLISADPFASILTFDWAIIDEVNNPSCSAENDTFVGCTPIDIFIDQNLLVQKDSSPTPQTNNVPDSPIFSYNTSVVALGDERANSAVFRTNLQLFSQGQNRSSLLFYPFDQYTAQIYMFAVDNVTRSPVALQIVDTSGIAVGFKIDSTDYSQDSENGAIDIVVTVKRGTLIQGFCIIATFAVWLITLVLLLLMFTSVVFGFRQKGEVLVVPVATVFAFTQLRGSMPGAPPGFGDVLDFVGLLPCLAILSIAAAVTLGAFIFTDPTETPHVLSWEIIRTKTFAKGPSSTITKGAANRDRVDGGVY